MTEYRRYRIAGGTYFFTVVLYDRRTALLTEHIDLLRDAVAEVKRKHPFRIDAMVVLPEHLHCILTLPVNDHDFSMRWRQTKSAFSDGLPVTERLSQSRSVKRERGIWQRRFWEHVITDQNDFNRHVNYIHFNPVKHRLTERVADWPYSTFSKYVERGIYPVTWGGDYIEKLSVAGE